MKRAFTLIELLVVIAIIAILAAILFPVFAQAKVSAKKAVAVSHQKQIGLAALMYSADYEDTFPLAYMYPHAGPGGGFPFVLAIYPYVKNVDLYVTPAGKPNAVNNADWNYIWSYGALPDARVKGYQNFEAEDNIFTHLVGITGAKYNGVFGWGQAGNVWGCWGDYCSVWPGAITVPSKSQSAIARVAEMAMVFDAGEPFADHVTSNRDGGGPLEGPLGRCAALRRGYNPGSWSIAGATGRWGGATSCTGWIAYPGFNTNYTAENARQLLTGQTVTTFADGHVKVLATSKFYSRMDCGDGSLCLQYLWPNN